MQKMRNYWVWVTLFDCVELPQLSRVLMGTMINLQMVSRCLLVQLVHHRVRLQHGKYELKSLKMLQHWKCKDFSVKMHCLLKKVKVTFLL